MTKEELREAIAVAGAKYDGHVTHGSLDEVMKVVEKYLEEHKPSDPIQVKCRYCGKNITECLPEENRGHIAGQCILGERSSSEGTK